MRRRSRMGVKPGVNYRLRNVRTRPKDEYTTRQSLSEHLQVGSNTDRQASMIFSGGTPILGQTRRGGWNGERRHALVGQRMKAGRMRVGYESPVAAGKGLDAPYAKTSTRVGSPSPWAHRLLRGHCERASTPPQRLDVVDNQAGAWYHKQQFV